MLQHDCGPDSLACFMPILYVKSTLVNLAQAGNTQCIAAAAELARNYTLIILISNKRSPDRVVSAVPLCTPSHHVGQAFSILQPYPASGWCHHVFQTSLQTHSGLQKPCYPTRESSWVGTGSNSSGSRGIQGMVLAARSTHAHKAGPSGGGQQRVSVLDVALRPACIDHCSLAISASNTEYFQHTLRKKMTATAAAEAEACVINTIKYPHLLASSPPPTTTITTHFPTRSHLPAGSTAC